MSSLSFLLCHPQPETAHLVIIDELNSGLFERCLDPDQCGNIAGNWPITFFYALNRGRPDPGGLRQVLLSPTQESPGGSDLRRFNHQETIPDSIRLDKKARLLDNPSS